MTDGRNLTRATLSDSDTVTVCYSLDRYDHVGHSRLMF